MGVILHWFQSYFVFWTFYQCLLPAAENLTYYWSESTEMVKEEKDGHCRRTKMALQDLLFLTLVSFTLLFEKRIWPFALEFQ